ncbi:hypothetical protein OHA98_13540 [Streptomyces sp. NBC_00654]|uniref:hypothetical protein n=1 Tax=Streptomyces sp. NBC_00654 TaxID=2975799 RepID=UPI002258A436|nr:hypothetical protein [Streptomyces sp. NBC_00654]MCX4965844.1 hypothetical protein [Streptomyces sp. NBC_00654]
MTPLPGPPRGSAPPQGRQDATARRARHTLALLLLAVLTLIGGVPAAAGAALPARAFSGPAHVAAHAPGASAPAQHTDRTAHIRQIHDLRRARPAAAHGHDVRTAVATGPDSRRTRTAALTADDRPRAAATAAPHPRAGVLRAQAPSHSPPPCHSVLPPHAPVLPAPGTRTVCFSHAAFRLPDGSPATLPGVRGPPGTAAGPTTGHRSCPTDLPSRPR